MSSSFGHLFRVTTFGESHGPALGCVVDGCPPRLPLSAEDLACDLRRRRPGQSALTTPRREDDLPELLSGVHEGLTTGTPIAVLLRSTDARPGDYEALARVYRPSHADWSYQAKYGHRDPRGGGRASARETAARVAAGAIARRLLAERVGVEVLAWVQSVGEVDAAAAIDPAAVDAAAVETTPVRCPSPAHAAAMEQAIAAVRAEGDSLGGVVCVVARGVPAGWGEPVFDKLEADLGKALLSLPAARGVEIGSGFQGARWRGSQHNDPFLPGPDGRPRPAKNDAGGTLGGISSGAPLLLRVAFKPTATIRKAQATVDRAGAPVELEAAGRHDPCVVPRAVPIVEAMVLLTLADHFLRHEAQCGPAATGGAATMRGGATGSGAATGSAGSPA